MMIHVHNDLRRKEICESELRNKREIRILEKKGRR
jgi:hypothetical protein